MILPKLRLGQFLLLSSVVGYSKHFKMYFLCWGLNILCLSCHKIRLTFPKEELLSGNFTKSASSEASTHYCLTHWNCLGLKHKMYFDWLCRNPNQWLVKGSVMKSCMGRHCLCLHWSALPFNLFPYNWLNALSVGHSNWKRETEKHLIYLSLSL